MSAILERFNKVYKQFLDELNKTFQIKSSLNDDQYLEDFVKHIMPYVDNISVCNEDFFKLTKDPILHVSHNISFKHIFNHTEYQNKKTKVSFWKYLHTLYLLSTKLQDKILEICDNKMDPELVKMVKLVTSSQTNMIDNLKRYKPDSVFTHDTHPIPKINKKKEKELEEINESLNEEDGTSDFFDNSLIGQLAKDLSSKVNPEDMKNVEGMGNPMDLLGSLLGGGSGGAGMGALGNVMDTVCKEMFSKFTSGELDQQKLMAEAQKMMGGLFPMPPGGMPQGGMPQGWMPPGGMTGDDMPTVMDANTLRQMGFQNMMNNMMGNQPNTKPKKGKKKVIRRKKK